MPCNLGDSFLQSRDRIYEDEELEQKSSIKKIIKERIANARRISAVDPKGRGARLSIV